MLYVCRSDNNTILGVYATAQDAMDASAGRVSAGRRVEIIPAEAAPGSDLPPSGPVWIWTARGGASLTAFSTMEDADARRSALGGTVRGFEISYDTGGGTRGMGYDASRYGGDDLTGATGEWAHRAGDLRKSAADMELLKVIAVGARQDFPADSNDPATRAAAYTVGFVKQIRKAFGNPKTMGARL